MVLNLSRKNSYFFYELHIFNLPIAFLLKLHGNVYVFKYIGICSYFLNNDFFPSIQDFKNSDQWLESKEKAHEKIKANLNSFDKIIPKYNLNQTRLNLKNCYIQRFSIQYEAYLFFITLVNNHTSNNYIIDYQFRKFVTSSFPELISENEHQLKIFHFAIADSVFKIFESFLNTLRMVYKLVHARNKQNKIKQKFNYFIAGISQGEHPSSESHLDFSWLAKNGILDSNEVLYLLESEPSQKVKIYLKSNNIHYTTKSHLIYSLCYKTKISIILSYIFSFIKNFPMHYNLHFLIELQIQSVIWNFILSEFKPKFFINSFSSGWPEQFEILVSKSLNIKTIMWFYSAGEFQYSRLNQNFKDLSVRFSIFESDELWVWNNQVKELIEQRLFMPSDGKKILVMGSILNGYLNSISKGKRDNIFTISVFDLTPMKRRVRLNFGQGPFCNSELQESFYQSILKIHSLFPEIRILIKTKRNANPKVYDEVPSLSKLRNTNSENVIFLPNSLDPYLAISDANLVISVPYTSPSMMALSFGLKAIYYDPLDVCKYTFKNTFKKSTIVGEKNLLDFIAEQCNLANNNIQSEFQIILPNQIEKEIKTRLSC